MGSSRDAGWKSTVSELSGSRIGGAKLPRSRRYLVNPNLDTLATTLNATVDDLLIQHPEFAPQRPAVGTAPRPSDAELVTLAVMVLVGFDTESRFLRYAHAHLGPWFPCLPTRAGCNKR